MHFFLFLTLYIYIQFAIFKYLDFCFSVLFFVYVCLSKLLMNKTKPGQLELCHNSQG